MREQLYIKDVLRVLSESHKYRLVLSEKIKNKEGKSKINKVYFFNQAQSIEDNKIQTHKNRRFLGIDNVNLGNEIEAAVQTYYPELMSSGKKNFVEFINKE